MSLASALHRTYAERRAGARQRVHAARQFADYRTGAPAGLRAVPLGRASARDTAALLAIRGDGAAASSYRLSD